MTTTAEREKIPIECVRVPVEVNYDRHAWDLMKSILRAFEDPEYEREFQEWKKKEGIAS